MRVPFIRLLGECYLKPTLCVGARAEFVTMRLSCKKCGENIPAPVKTMPDTWIVAVCPLCCQRRAYLPTDIFRGSLSHRLAAVMVVRRSAQEK
jgi:hypothetical protein